MVPAENDKGLSVHPRAIDCRYLPFSWRIIPVCIGTSPVLAHLSCLLLSAAHLSIVTHTHFPLMPVGAPSLHWHTLCRRTFLRPSLSAHLPHSRTSPACSVLSSVCVDALYTFLIGALFLCRHNTFPARTHFSYRHPHLPCVGAPSIPCIGAPSLHWHTFPVSVHFSYRRTVIANIVCSAHASQYTKTATHTPIQYSAFVL